MTLGLDAARKILQHQRRLFELETESFDETEEFDLSCNLASFKPSSLHHRVVTGSCTGAAASSSSRMNRSSAGLAGRRSKFSSLHRSYDSTESSNSSNGSDGLPSKSTYRILFLGASRTGKTSIVRQFLYDQFSPSHNETMDDMYRGEFEDSFGKTINFDIQDVGGGFVYEFPGMRSVSLASADAFVLVFSLDTAETWDEVSKLRDMVIDAKDPDVPIVIVANKSDLQVDTHLPYVSLEATATFDWENGYVECSAKERTNINKIFKVLLNQAKTRFDVSVTSPNKPCPGLTTSAAVARHLPGKSIVQSVHIQRKVK